MFGTIVGDVIGSVYEFRQTKDYDFPLFSPGSNFTDDTVLTIAVADAILNNRDYSRTLKYYGRKYPYSGYGGSFKKWLISDDMGPYNSWGNGSAMRVSPVGYVFDDLEMVLKEAEKSASVTHNHPEGIKGAQATALAIFLARTGKSKTEIREEIISRFGYDLSRTCDEIRPTYKFHESCQKTVPEAIIAFLDSHDFEDAIRKAVSLGGDSDTLGAITGGIAQAYYKSIPKEISRKVNALLPEEFREIIEKFNKRYGIFY